MGFKLLDKSHLAPKYIFWTFYFLLDILEKSDYFHGLDIGGKKAVERGTNK